MLSVENVQMEVAAQCDVNCRMSQPNKTDKELLRANKASQLCAQAIGQVS